MFFIILQLLSISSTHSLTDELTSWTRSSSRMPFPDHSQALGYDTHTGIIHFIGGACSTCQTHYHTYNTLTNTMSPVQSIPNDGRAPDQPFAQFYIQIKQTLYMYNHDHHCLDTFDMAAATFTSCWSPIHTILPTGSGIKGCLSVDDTGRYFYIIPDTNTFFFYDSMESAWYTGPDTIQKAHLYAGCDVVDHTLMYWGGQPNRDSEGDALTASESLDISDMEALKMNPDSFSWSIQEDFLPFEHDFVRSVRFHEGTIYSIGRYKSVGDGGYIEVLAMDFSTNQVHQSVDIETYGIGGSLIWDPCQRCLYYFGGFNGSTELDTIYISNSMHHELPSVYQMECKIQTKDTFDPHVLHIMLFALLIWVVLCVGCIVLRKYKQRNGADRDDKEASLSEDIHKMPDFALRMGPPISTIVPSRSFSSFSQKPGTSVLDVDGGGGGKRHFVEGNDLWDPKMMGVRVQLQNDLKTLIVEKGFVWATACMKREVDTGVHSWTFEVEEYHGEKGVNGWNIMIGIWKKHMISKQYIDYFYCTEPGAGYAYVASDGVLTDPLKGAVAGAPYGIAINEDDTPYVIEMIVDLENKTLSYTINGEDYGVAFGDIEDTMYVAAISFMPHLGRQQLKFISYKSKL